MKCPKCGSKIAVRKLAKRFRCPTCRSPLKAKHLNAALWLAIILSGIVPVIALSSISGPDTQVVFVIASIIAIFVICYVAMVRVVATDTKP